MSEQDQPAVIDPPEKTRRPRRPNRPNPGPGVRFGGPHPASLANLRTWVPGQSGNPSGINTGGKPGPRKASGMIHALIELAIEDGRVDQAVDSYFELMLKSKDDRLRFDVMRDFFDRVGLPRVTDNPKVSAQIVNIVRSNSPDLNL